MNSMYLSFGKERSEWGLMKKSEDCVVEVNIHRRDAH
jgi:hypothetical protein